jgi:hypothetical protein
MNTQLDHEVMLAIGRLEGKLDLLLQQRQAAQVELKELDNRVRHLEQSRSYIIGAAGVVAAIVSALFQYTLASK